MKPYKIYGEEHIEGGAIDQFWSAMELDWVRQGALMPDAHQGYSLPIGGVIATDSVVVPSWVGYDIGCGMCAIPTSYHPDVIRDRAQEIFEEIYEWVPVGFKHNKRPVSWRDYATLPKTSQLDIAFYDKGGLKQLGTLGGGNHFIEIGESQNSQIWIIVHSGSRNVGHTTATHYMREASEIHTGKRKAREGHYGFSKDTHKEHYNAYVIDCKFCEEFALANRTEIIRRVGQALRSINLDGDVYWDECINRNHNHLDFKDDMVIHRKGATHADKGMLGVIPGNMRDGSFIVRGLGNPDSLFSSSHGAGRVLSRKAAKGVDENGDPWIPMEAFEKEMEGIAAKVTESTKDESPFAYKDIYTVMEEQKNLVTILQHITPIINVKG
jgi:tRNA-splicing ligase RtcB